MTAASRIPNVAASGSRPVLAWDLPTRLFKWALVALVFDAWLSDSFGSAVPTWHKWNGYGVLVLVTFRIFWGFAGGSTARFAGFVRPVAALRYVTGRSQNVRPYLGHNPLGGLMVVALLILCGLQATLGLFSADQDRLVIEGPLAHTLSDRSVDFASHWHGIIFNVILAFVTLHILANVVYNAVKRQPVVAAMITGRKPAADYTDAREAEPGSPTVALLCFVAAIAVVFGAITAFGGKLFW